MAQAKCTEEEFIRDYRVLGPTRLAQKLGMTRRRVFTRRRDIESRRGIPITTTLMPGGPNGRHARDQESFPEHVRIDVKDGIVLIGSDLHIWPGERSTAIRAFLHFQKEYDWQELKIKAIILNGDILDFPRISRHPSIGWQTNPQPAAEIEASQDILHDIEQACGRGVRKVWPIGNHDERFETNIANHCPEYANVHGIHLSDHFPNWEKCYLARINDDVSVTHRFKGGMHAPQNNTLWSGKHYVTGHLHSQKVMPITDENGTRYGVDTGCMADIYATQFRDYTKENPRNWRSGFGVFTFRNSRLMPPELVTVIDKNHVAFRGELIKV